MRTLCWTLPARSAGLWTLVLLLGAGIPAAVPSPLAAQPPAADPARPEASPPQPEEARPEPAVPPKDRASEPPAAEAPVVRDELTVTTRPETAPYSPPEEVSATRSATPILLTPQSIQVVPRAVLDDQKVLTLTEAVRNVSGTASDFGFNGSTQPLLILRGFQSTSMSASGSMSGSSSYYLDGTKVQGIPINMANVQSVEVVKGPATVLFGRSEPGGLVNVVSRVPQAARAFAFEQTVGGYGTSRTLLEGSGALNRSQTLLGRAAVSFVENGSNRDFVVDRGRSATGNLTWVPGERTRLALTFDASEQKYRNDFGLPALGDRPADLPWSRQYNDSPELSRTRTTSILLDLRHQISAQWSVSAKVLNLEGKTREVDVWPYRLDLATFEDCLASRNELCRYYFNVRPNGRYRLRQAGADLKGELRTGILTHRLLLGLDHYQTSKAGLTYLQFLSPVDIDHPDLGHTGPLDPSQSLISDTEDRSRWNSVYVQDEIGIGSRFRIVAALRHDRTSAIFAARGTAPNEQTFTTPRFGLVWQAAPNHALYAQYQDSVAANNGRDPVTLKELDAERAEQIEAGYKVATPDGRLTSTLAAFQLVKRNRADFSLFPTVRTIGEARSRGLEWDFAGQLGRRLALLGSYAYTDAVVTEDPQFKGIRLANVPRHSGSLWARYTFGDRWAAGGGVFFQGQRVGDLGDTFRLPGYARCDAMVSYDFRLLGARSLLQLNVDNLANRRYYTGSHPFVQDWIQVSKPRTASLTLRLDY